MRKLASVPAILSVALLSSLAGPGEAAVQRSVTQVKVTAGDTAGTVGDKSLVSGLIFSGEKVRAVRLQKQVDGVWRNNVLVQSGVKGYFSTRLSHDAVGQDSYRWRVRGTATAQPVLSKTFTISTTGVPTKPTDGKFSFVVIGDTQSEVLGDESAKLFSQRTQWIAANEAKEDIRFVASTGDISYWGWLIQAQYDRGLKALATLKQAGIPYAVSVGNHDTRITGWNGTEGSRRYGAQFYTGNPECKERFGTGCTVPLLLRQTQEFNANFKAADFGAVKGAYRAGAMENSYSTFNAEGTQWLMLNMEVWPRTEVVNWAKTVVASHPNHNVVIQTHSYLTGSGSIGNSASYGSNSPRYIFDNLVSKYPNIKMVFSGHEGTLATRVDTVNGNKVVSYLGNKKTIYASTRIVTVNVATNTVSTRAFIGENGPASERPAATTAHDGMNFVKP